MAARTTKVRTEGFWREPLEAAQERLARFEVEAQKALTELVEKGRRSREEIEQLLRGGEVAGRAEELRARLEKRGLEMVRRLEGLQESALAALGVAGKAQVDELGAEIRKLGRKIDEIARSARPAGPRGKTVKS